MQQTPSPVESPTSVTQPPQITGMQVHYYVLCPRKLWWFTHGMEQEHVEGPAGQQNVELGSLLHDNSYPDRARKDVIIDDLIRLDFTEAGQVHEIKKSRGAQRAGVMQLLYYLYYLKHVKGIVTTGVMNYPKERRTVELELTPEREKEVEEILAGVQNVRELAVPPNVPAPMPICKKCAYQDLCWG